jgi:RNA recognition motif-containing protein
MAKKLYVGGISYNTTQDGLKDAFSKAGEVESVSIIVDKMTGKSRGFGFVTIADEAVQAAIDMFHGKDLDGRTLTVNEARPMAPRGDRPQRSGGYDRDRGGDRRSF